MGDSPIAAEPELNDHRQPSSIWNFFQLAVALAKIGSSAFDAMESAAILQYIACCSTPLFQTLWAMKIANASMPMAGISLIIPNHSAPAGAARASNLDSNQPALRALIRSLTS